MTCRKGLSCVMLSTRLRPEKLLTHGTTVSGQEPHRAKYPGANRASTLSCFWLWPLVRTSCGPTHLVEADNSEAYVIYGQDAVSSLPQLLETLELQSRAAPPSTGRQASPACPWWALSAPSSSSSWVTGISQTLPRHMQR